MEGVDDACSKAFVSLVYWALRVGMSAFDIPRVLVPFFSTKLLGGWMDFFVYLNFESVNARKLI